KAVTDLCRGKRNLLFLTHLDWDHISFIPQFRRFFPQICLDPRSQFHESTKKPFFWKTLALCEDSDPDVELIQLTEADFQNRVQPRKPHISSNDLSLIWTLKTILIPGD